MFATRDIYNEALIKDLRLKNKAVDHIQAGHWNMLPLRYVKMLVARYGIEPFWDPVRKPNGKNSYRRVGLATGFSDVYVAKMMQDRILPHIRAMVDGIPSMSPMFNGRICEGMRELLYAIGQDPNKVYCIPDPLRWNLNAAEWKALCRKYDIPTLLDFREYDPSFKGIKNEDLDWQFLAYSAENYLRDNFTNVSAILSQYQVSARQLYAKCVIPEIIAEDLRVPHSVVLRMLGRG